MTSKARYWGLGQRVAPPRFVLFALSSLALVALTLHAALAIM